MTKNGFIYALKTSGCLYHNGQTYYEENELIRTFEDMEMFEEFEEEKSLKDMTELEHAIKHIKTRADAWAVKEVTEALQSISVRLDKALSQEPCRVKNELNVELNELKPCTDAVSREAVKDLIKSGVSTDTSDDVVEVCKWIDALPSVSPQKSGKWIETDDKYGAFFICDKCHRQSDIMENFCPNCGARMESEDKE